ncbi:regulation of enolase protein 1 (concanavalin A-like superfamily) [Kribbella aluminosa]|uniref:Regulation of enolase protein 1 (Concanavalin A-like superfamily) n=1 Tax=Kribbella aluminosa TaxID=416017 RepID=A0ABS4UQ31_9ACTN|nr:family 43 glycosylhydrolase [Kribbella aluminosa]MBP2353752.1 regulation of enolase protein 1 (concanavalin A-like superfamily) [Kribbella aluminosa]
MIRLSLLAAGLTLLVSSVSHAAAPPAAGYTNPVTAGYSADFPDPSMIKGRDGWWYAYSTGGPYAKDGHDGDSYKIARSRDLTHWEKVGSVFGANNRPTWADPSSGFWAPDIRYLDGKYVLYFTVPNTTTTPGDWDYAIGAATAPTPAGPWTDSGAPVVAPRPAAGGGFQWTIDPAEFTDTDGTRYLYWGSYNGGIHAVRLTPDGLRTVGAVTDVARDRFEGAYVVKHDGYYYLFGSSSNCCAGPTTGYAVFAGRSRSPLGPFLDREGHGLNASRTGGTPVVAPNGNRWVGTGHASVVTDLSGQQWLAYHGVDRTDPFVTNSNGWLLRPMLLDRLDWIDGWPEVNAGAGPRESSKVSPVTTSTATQGNVRVEADVTGTGQGVSAHGVTAVLNKGQLKVTNRAGFTRSVPVPLDVPGTIALEIRNNQATAEFSEDRLGDPLATVQLPALPGAGAAAPVGGAGNFSVAPLYKPVTRAAPTPRIGRVDPQYSDEFTRGLGAGWTWRNVSPDATVANGALRWKTETNDLTDNNTAAKASLLLRDQPSGNFVVETKLHLDVGTDTVRNYQQAGLLVYLDDENWMRLDHVAGGTSRFVEFGKRMRFTPVGAPSVVTFGGAMIGPPAETTWLRLAHDVVPQTGEHRYRAASSTDGKHWVWGAAWTLPAGTTPRIGLVSQGSSAQTEAQYGKATAQFDYFRVMRPPVLD